MSIDKVVIEKLRELSPEQKQELLQIIEDMKRKNQPVEPRKSLAGLWADLGVDIMEEDIAEARREMWGNFSHEVAKRSRS